MLIAGRTPNFTKFWVSSTGGGAPDPPRTPTQHNRIKSSPGVGFGVGCGGGGGGRGDQDLSKCTSTKDPCVKVRL